MLTGSVVWRWIAAVVCALALGLAHWLHLDDRARLWFKQHTTPEAERAAYVWLPDYRAVIQALPIEGLEQDETSGLTYNEQTGTLFTVTGHTPQLVELSRQGKVLRRIELKGFSDPEAVEVMAQGRMAIIDERKRRLVSFSLEPDQHVLDAAHYPSLDLGFEQAGNKGFEALAWDARSQRLVLGKERSPMGIFAVTLDQQHLPSGAPTLLSHAHLGVRDISSLSIDPRTGHALLLSDESRLLLELNRAGELVSFMSLGRGGAGLEQGIEQPEGIAVDEQGDIYIVAEPNLFYRFSKRGPEAE